MNEAKPFASLSSGLLARKGSAKPAMRPQGFGNFGGLEDLGWNDMGHGSAPAPQASQEQPIEHVPSSIAALTPAPKTQDSAPFVREEAEPDAAPDVTPEVVEQQRAIAANFPPEEVEEIEEEPIAVKAAPAPKAPVVALPKRPRQPAGLKDKAAFTLRLDQERHLKLRLACAVKHRSAQQIVSEALDDFLNRLPELDALTQQLPARAGKPS